MKTIIILCLLVVPFNLIAQRGGTVEIYMWTSGFSPTTEVDFYLDACGPIWDEDQDLTTVDTLLHSSLNIPEQFDGWSMSHGDDYDNGWDFVTSQTSQETPKYGWGLYKVSTDESDSYFYIDFRDDRWPGYSTPVTGHSTDIWLRYDEDDDEFEYNPGDDNWETASDGDYVTLWGIKDKGDPSVGDFEAYWTNCLNVTYNSNGNPRIVWTKHPSFSPISGYKIYRANNTDPDTEPSAGSYALEATVNSSTITYTDTDVRLSDTEDDITWYYVKAYYTHPKTQVTTYSSSTNSVHTDDVEFYKLIGEQKSIVSKYYPKLHQNYPNPFNPTTTISFDLPKESTVHLEIFNVQGKVVSTLVNETMDEGSHIVRFNSSGLPSGVYFYRLQTQEFTDIKRMLLLK